MRTTYEQADEVRSWHADDQQAEGQPDRPASIRQQGQVDLGPDAPPEGSIEWVEREFETNPESVRAFQDDEGEVHISAVPPPWG